VSDDDIAAFASARLDEVEAVAKAATEAAGQWFEPGPGAGEWSVRNNRAIVECPTGIIAFDEGCPTDAQAAHIARHDPARALREVEAGRAILRMHRPTPPHPEFGFTYPAAARFCGYCGPGDNWQAEQEPDHYPDALWPCRHVRILAAIDSDHPDYRPEWAPDR
jgi:hypothetical protein